MDLTGKLLAAMPGMGDARFDRALILVCSHSSGGAMGLIINQIMPDLSFPTLLKQLGIQDTDVPQIEVHYGGPVERSRGFVLHRGDYDSGSAMLQIGADYRMSATVDVLEDIAFGQGPAQALLALGYSGWGPQQLEAEIADNAWLSIDTVPEVIFAQANAQKWATALRQAGIDPVMLSGAAGHA
jgi:putative transcriptional regulator